MSSLVDIPERYYPYRRLLAWCARRSKMFSLKFDWLATFCERPASTTPQFEVQKKIIDEEICSEDRLLNLVKFEVPTQELVLEPPVKRRKTNK
jgi:hypothetical protein